MALVCPRCKSSLKAVRLEGGTGPEIDVCPGCHGAWYDEGETKIEILVKGPQPAATVCPRCTTALWIGRYGDNGPELDYCTRCGGVWADKGELEAIGAIEHVPATDEPGRLTAPFKHTTTPKKSDYRFTVEGRPEFAMATIELEAGQSLKAEASAMASMDVNVTMTTKFKGGFSRLFTGESLFINEFKAEGGPGKVSVAPGSPGDLGHHYVEGEPIFLQRSAYVASSPEVVVETKYQGLTKTFFSGEAMFLIKCSGKGDLWFNTYGAMIPIEVNGEYVVDTGHIVGFTAGLQYQVTKLGGYKSLFLSGEGFVCRFSGNGRVWIQTRQMPALATWVWPFRPAKG